MFCPVRRVSGRRGGVTLSTARVRELDAILNNLPMLLTGNQSEART